MNRAHILFLLFSLSVGLEKSSAEDWPRFRGPNGTGRSEEARDLPIEWSNDQHVAWKTPIPRGSSSPIIVGKQIFITGYSGYAVDPSNPGDRENLELHVLSYRVADGALLWDYQFKASDQEQAATKRVADHGYASPTACSDGKYVFASFGPSGLVALTVDGEFLWQQDLGDGVAGFGAAASPIEFEDLVMINASIESGRLLAFDKRTGEIQWTVEGVERAWTTPAIVRRRDGNAELVIHFKNQILAVDPRSGEQLWHATGIPDYIVPTPVVVDDMLYLSGGRQNRTLAIRSGGQGDVSEQVLWNVPKGANVTSPIYHEGHLYWSHDKAFAQVLRVSDGEVVTQERFKNRDRVYGSVVYGDNKLYMIQRDGTTLVLAAQPEYQELAVNQLGGDDEQFNATPALWGDSIILRSTDFLYRIKH